MAAAAARHAARLTPHFVRTLPKANPVTLRQFAAKAAHTLPLPKPINPRLPRPVISYQPVMTPNIRALSTEMPKPIPASPSAHITKIESYDFLKPPIRKIHPKDMQLKPFIPPKDEESVEEYDLRMKQQKDISWSDCSENIVFGDHQSHPTTHNIHEKTMQFGYFPNPNKNGKLERSLVKSFETHEIPLARREIAAAYIGHLLGLGKYFPKVYGIKEDGFFAVVRRFVRGMDTRIVAHNPAEAKKIPAEDVIALYTFDTLVAQNDSDNIRNLIKTFNSEVVHSPICPIDHERMCPNEELILLLQRRGIELRWEPGEPIKGTLEWRQICAKELGKTEFMEKLLEYKYVNDNPTMNPYLAILKEQGHTPETLSQLEVPTHLIDTIIQKAPKINGILTGMGIYKTEEITSGKLSISQTIRAWQHCREQGIPITVGMLMTADYPALP